MGDGYTPISILHFSLDFLNINSIPGKFEDLDLN